MADSSRRSVDTKPWTHAVNKVLAFAEEKGTRIVGVIGDRVGVGVSLLSRELAHAYAQHGVKAILVDASRVDMTMARPQGQNAHFELLAAAQETSTGISVVDLAEYAGLLPAELDGMKQIFEQAIAASDNLAIVVDLPAVHSPNAQSLSRVGSACQLVYLLCLSGVITKTELSDCIVSCKINRVPVGGIIVNDWKQPGAWIATR